ncbi:MAG: hypothetical protein A3J29_05020 [Acidobacteria bacterium RIFCSPLOWO2_12_FULL_67_14b]|nr:MAG: hypothetical protein A3J29_05020 [Acidobacteria bacterium RIFCSPLOWO2_12_FULL_67_14b]
MSSKVRIAVACPIPGERAAFMEWLSEAGYEPIPMLDLDCIARDLGARPVEALIADAVLVPAVELPRVVRILGSNRPLMLVGAPGSAPEIVPRDATWVERPVTCDTFLLSVALALAEGRPARRSPRKGVPKLTSSIDGVAARVMDVSAEGVRLEVSEAQPAVLPPYFTLRVPGFGVITKVKRVWVAMPPQGSIWCGGIVDKAMPAKAKTTWQSFVEAAPSTAEIIHRESRPYL